MKKMTVPAVILALAIALTACGGEKAAETTAPATTTATVAATVPETTVPAEPLALTEWDMSASTWSSPNGATIHITATPNYYLEGQKADFVIRLESDEIATVACQWDGSAYTASADLNAADGYCYYVVLTDTDGTAAEVAVNTPTEPTDTTLIDMETALNSYCSVTISESGIENNLLTLVSGNVQVQAPLITNNGESITCQEAILVLSLNGEALGEKTVVLTPGETGNLYEAALENIVFEIPELESEQSVDLTVTAALSNSQILSTYGGNWISGEDGLMAVVG